MKKDQYYLSVDKDIVLNLKTHISSTLTLDIYSNGLRLENGVMSYSIIFRYYKLLDINLSPGALEVSPLGQSILVEVNLERSSVTILKLLEWNQVTKNPIWNLEGVSKPFKRQPDEARIEEYPNGSFEEFEEEQPRSKVKEFIHSRPIVSTRLIKSTKQNIDRSASLRCK